MDHWILLHKLEKQEVLREGGNYEPDVKSSSGMESRMVTS
jgi:hypothetical protein